MMIIAVRTTLARGARCGSARSACIEMDVDDRAVAEIAADRKHAAKGLDSLGKADG